MIDPDRPLLAFGGPYSHLQATEAMLAEARRRGIAPGNIICTGDVVAYAANPEETAQLIRGAGIHVVAGNCEAVSYTHLTLPTSKPKCRARWGAGE